MWLIDCAWNQSWDNVINVTSHSVITYHVSSAILFYISVTKKMKFIYIYLNTFIRIADILPSSENVYTYTCTCWYSLKLCIGDYVNKYYVVVYLGVWVGLPFTFLQFVMCFIVSFLCFRLYQHMAQTPLISKWKCTFMQFNKTKHSSKHDVVYM